MPGAEVRDQLSSFLVGERVAEGRHLRAAVENLAGQLWHCPHLVLAQRGGQCGGLLGACKICAVAMGAPLIKKERRACRFVGFGLGIGECAGWQGCAQKNGQRQ